MTGLGKFIQHTCTYNLHGHVLTYMYEPAV